MILPPQPTAEHYDESFEELTLDVEGWKSKRLPPALALTPSLSSLARILIPTLYPAKRSSFNPFCTSSLMCTNFNSFTL